jgi:hypothetical protein
VNTREVLEVGIDRVSVGPKLPLFRAPRPRPEKPTATAKSIRFAPETGPFANVVSLADDETTGLIPIGFEFSFFENRYSSINISSNGFVGFEPDMSHGCCSGFIPSASDDGANNLIALAWADLYPPGGGEISYETRGSAPHRRMVISFRSIGWCCEEAGDRVTSQLILYEQKGMIEIHTEHLETGPVYTQGVENADGTVAAFLPGRVFAQFGLENDGVRFTTN